MDEIPRSANLLKQMIIQTPELFDSSMTPDIREQRIKDMADLAIKELPPPAYLIDKWVYRLVVIFLGFVSGAAIIGSIILSTGSNNIPDVLTALGAAAIGALAGMLAPSPVNR